MFGRDCAAEGEAAFCAFTLKPTSADGNIEMNESSGLGGHCNTGTFRPQSTTAPRPPFHVQALNASFNHATKRGSALDIGNRPSLNLLFCCFRSNSPANTVVIWKSDHASEAFHCLEFANNSVNSEVDTEFKGMICVNPIQSVKCEFHDSAFVGNRWTVPAKGRDE
jgi:hypothetical protein